jgi:hypothetical protein
MDRLVEAVAEYLCRHRSVGLFRLTLDLTRRRLDIFAEIGAVEVVKGVVSPPTPGTETRWLAAVREAVVAREGAGPVREGGRGGQLDSPADKPDAKPPTAKNGVLSPHFFSFFFSRGAEERRLDFTQRRVE